MKRDERGQATRTVRTDDPHTRDATPAQTVTRPSHESAEESKLDPYRDEGGES
jgi:hypothetical protein